MTKPALFPARLVFILVVLLFPFWPASAQITVGTDGANQVIGTNFTGAQTLTKVGTNQVALTGTNTYAGPTTISNGILQIGNNGSTGTLGAGDVINDSVLAFFRNNNYTVTNNISGTGSLRTLGANLFLQGSNSYSGGTLVSAATLWGDTLSIQGNITNNSFVRFTNTTTGTYAGNMSGTGQLVMAGAGTLTLSGTNTQAGGIIIAGTAGTVVGTTASLQGVLSNDLSTAKFVFDQATNGTFAGVFSGTGRLIKEGAGAVTFTNGFTNSLTINGGRFVVGRAIGIVTNNAELEYNLAGLGTNTGTISGTGSVIKSGAGTLVLGVTNGFTGPLSIEAGTVRLGTNNAVRTTGSVQTFSGGTFWVGTNSQTLASLTGDGGGVVLSNNTGLLTLNTASNTTYGGVISGQGYLVKNGAGTLTLIGANTVQGQIGGSTLTISNGWVSGSTASLGMTIAMSNVSSGVEFNQATNGLLGFNITGTGGLRKSGEGTLTINNGSRATYSGTTTIAAGAIMLSNTGFIASTNIVNNARLILNGTPGGSFDGSISGTGSLLLQGGRSVITASNSYAGGTELTGGSIDIRNVYSLGSGVISFTGGKLEDSATNRASLDISTRFSQDPGQQYVIDLFGVATYGANLTSVGGSLALGSSGVLTLSGTNTYDGGTLVGGSSTLRGTTTSLQGAITNNSQVQFNQSTNGTYAGSISGTGRLSKNGTSTVTLSGENTYTGTTEIQGTGRLIVSTASVSGSTNIFINTQAGSVEFNQSTNGTHGRVISGSGSLVKSGAGTLTLTAANTYTNATTITDGELRIGGGGTSGTLGSGGNVTNNAVLAFDRSDSLTVSNLIVGTGALIKAGAGTLTLSATNTYTGGTTIEAGTLATSGSNRLAATGLMTVNSGAALALGGNQTFSGLSGSGDVALGANVLTVGASNSTFAGVISGSGQLAKSGPGTTILSGDNTYTGSTTINSNAGTLQIGDGGTAGRLGAGSVTNNATLAFNRSDNTSVTNLISGSGALRKDGAGTMTLTANNTYTGATRVSSGGLIINGSIADSAVTVQSGGFLGGSGTVGSVTVESGGTVAPGNSPGTLNINGDIDWLGGGSYNWQIVAADGVAGTDWDLQVATGQLDLSALTASSQFNINLWSLESTGPDVSGALTDFNPNQNYTWTILTASNGITGFSADKFNINLAAVNGTDGFANALRQDWGFSIVQSGNDLNLVYGSSAAVPEPGTWAAAALLAGGAAFMRWRRSRRNAQV